MKITKKKSLLQRQLKMPRNTRLKPYTTRMANIQDQSNENIGMQETKPDCSV